MTAEIAILNRTAVSLAADSAITINRTDGQKIYHSANKVFTLSKYHPIGIMFYGNADLMNVPWETVIKIYRENLGDLQFARLEDHAKHFIDFLDKDNPLFSEIEQQKHVEKRIEFYFYSIEREITNKVKEVINNKNRINNDEITTIIDQQIKEHYEQWKTYTQLPSFPNGYVDEFKTKYKTVLENIIRKVFQELPLSPQQNNDLYDIASAIFCKDYFFASYYSGIVIAGFGKDETFPSCKTFIVEVIVNNKLKYRLEDRKCCNIGPEKNAAIIPFAQSEMVSTFITGTDPRLATVIYGCIKGIFEKYPEIIAKKIKDKSGQEILVNQLKTECQQILDEYNQTIRDKQQYSYIGPILDSVAVLPKDELASMAEALVNLTSFKRRITMDETETVGGPIDVAVISKGDGFIWIKRKHYFKAELNHHFMANYFKGGD